jgi:tetratricopeptide (TPR) repeat protein
MAIFYPFPAHFPLWQVIGSSILILLITVIIVIMAKRLPYFFTGWFWFAIIITPVIGIIRIADFTMADRYHYLPSIGIAVMLAWGVPPLFRNKNIGKTILFPAALIFLIIMAALTWKQCGYWKNNTTLWNHALNVTTGNYMAHNNLASALLEQGETQKAVYHYNQAIRINNYSSAYYNLGIIRHRLGQPQQAIGYFNEAIRQTPDYAAAYYNLGIVYYELGQHQHAMESYNEAIRIMPNNANAYNNRAFIYLNTGNRLSGCSNAIKACQLGNCKTLIWAKGKGICN